jgi:hypothetical protein
MDSAEPGQSTGRTDMDLERDPPVRSVVLIIYNIYLYIFCIIVYNQLIKLDEINNLTVMYCWFTRYTLDYIDRRIENHDLSES